MRGVSKEFIILPFLCGISHVSSGSQVTAWEGVFSEPNIIFSVLVGQPAAGKTPAMRLVTDSLNKLDEFNGIAQTESKLINGNK